MNKCIGCGETLQYEDINKIGYAVKGSDICKRCFDLTHYNKNIELNNYIDNNKLLENINKKKIFTIFLCDILSLSNETIKIYIYHHKTEFSDEYYGFNKYENLQLFKDLMNIKGIGCKFSFYISSNNVNAVKMAIKNKDIEYLSSIPHIGEKMALKIISAYKLKKIDNIDLIETLLTLGYLKKDIYEILDKIDPNDNLNEQIKQSLKILSERK